MSTAVTDAVVKPIDRRRRLRRWAAGAAVLATGLVAFGPVSVATGAAKRTTAGDTGSTVAASNPNHPVTTTKTVTRTNILPNGSSQTVLRKKVTLSVDVTAGLRTLQQVNVSWKGAQPTNYIDPDPNSSEAATYEEYPMVILECRGVDSTSVPVAQRLSPQTCWTQYNNERNLSAPGTEFPPWRIDRHAGKLGLFPNEPKTLPANCPQSALGEADYFLPLKGNNGSSYYSGPTAACSKLSPEQGGFTAEFPDNTTFGVTNTDGTGRAKFVIWSDETNATLGCSSSVKCSLVAIPVVGTSCDEQIKSADEDPSDITHCTYADSSSGQLENGPSELSSPGLMALSSVDGQTWWSASNWHNRISIPLSFALPADYCSVVSGRPSVFVYGSELMNEAAEQWSPTFCTDKKLSPFTQIAQAEPAAVNELGERSVDAAYDTYPPPPAGKAGPPVVNAPVALSGFAISTVVDDAQHHEVFDVKLDARLLAKLLTESYPDQQEVADEDGATGNASGPMANNPLNITLDPEFRALNPEIPEEDAGSGGQILTSARATLEALSSNSDVMKALTSYLAADPAAMSFISGTPDPWGMVVNPAYKGTSVPTDFWELKDTFVPTTLYNHDSTGCFAQTRFQVPYLPLVAAPLLTLASIAYNMEFALPNSTTSCSLSIGDPAADKITAGPRQQPGFRFLLGIVSLSEAKRYDLDTAELESQSVDGPDTKFTSSAGSTFVAPTNASLKLAAEALKPDTSNNSFQLDYDALRSNAAEKGAYPGAMLTSMSVPTAGLAAPTATAYSQMLAFAAGAGQKPGSAFGQLAAGYLPMTAANGMAAEVAYTNRAAAAVAAQACQLPHIDNAGQTHSTWTGCPTKPLATTSPTPTTSPTTSATPGTSTPSSAPPTSQTSLPPVATQSASPAPSAGNVAPSVAPTTTQAAAVTPASPVGPLGTLIPALLVVAIVAGAGAAAPVLARRRRARRRRL